MRNSILILVFLFCFSVSEARERFDRGIKTSTFVPKGQWIAGGKFSYSENENSNYKFLILDSWDGTGYSFKISPFAGYCFKDNMAAGLSFSYSRDFIKLDQMSIKLTDDLSFDFKDVDYVSHMFSATAFLRTYINLGDSKRFGLFNEARFTLGGGEGRNRSGKGETMTGTYDKIINMQIGMAPGLVAFVQDMAAVEVSVGVLGFDFKWTDQVTNQVHKGYRRKSSGNFKIDLFSINLGLAFYL